MRVQRGFVMLELLLGMLIMTLLAVWGANTVARRIDDTAAQSAAVWMLSVRHAAKAYTERYAHALLAADPSTEIAVGRYANWSAPTLAELKADDLLSHGFPEGVQHVGGAEIRVLREGDCPGPACRLAILIHSSQPLVHKGTTRVHEQMLAQWLMSTQGLGGRVSQVQPDTIGGGSFRYANPPVAGGTALPAGTVAVAVTAEQLESAGYLRVGDIRDPDFQGKLSVQGDAEFASDLRVSGYLRLDKLELWQSRCNEKNALAQDRYGGLLMCIGGYWQAASRNAGGYSRDSVLGCRKLTDGQGVNPITHDCSCPAGYSSVLISDSGPPSPGGSRVTGYLCVNQ